MNVIFLDIDYVLNGSNTTEIIQGIRGIDDDKVALLKQLINRDTIIVLTSTWRHHWNKTLGTSPQNSWPKNDKNNYGRYINMKLAKQNLIITDKTDDIYWSYRALEIIKWLNEHKVDNFVILDDEDFNWARHRLFDHWVNTYEIDNEFWTNGITPYHINKAKEILKT